MNLNVKNLAYICVVGAALSLSGCANVEKNTQLKALSIIDELARNKDRSFYPAGDGGSSGG